MDMLRKFIFLGLLVAAGSPVVGQNYNADRVDRPNTKKINIGIKAGFNSSMFMVSELKIKDVTSQVPSFATYGENTMKSLLRISTKRVFTKSCIRSMSAQ